MSIEFTTAFTETPVVEFLYPVDNLQSLFDDYTSWGPNLELNGLGYNELTKRLTKSSDKVSGAKWKELILEMNNIKLQLIKHMLEIDTENRWPSIPEQISKQMVVYLSLVTDLPGYKMEPHIDNRTVYAAGYLNVFDNESLTVVSTQKESMFRFQKSNQYRAPGDQGRGVIWLNTDNSWHWVNSVSRTRRIIMISFHIVPWG
jgi:hypothetical protein